MLVKLTRASLMNRSVVALLTVLIAAAGILSLRSLKQELFPDFAAPVMTVITTSPGASPEVVDEQVTVPLTTALRQVDGIDDVTSNSSSGVSTISLATDFGVDSDQLTADVQTAINSVLGRLPTEATPELIAGNLDDLPAMTLTVSSDLSTAELGERLAAVAMPELRGNAGVRDVTVSGGLTQRITIQPDVEKLNQYGLTTDAIRQALLANGTTSPVGSIVEADGRVTVQVGNTLSGLQDIEDLPLVATPTTSSGPQPGSPLTAPTETPPEGTPTTSTAANLSDVAEVTVSDDPATSITRVNGQPAVSIQIVATKDADLVTLSEEINSRLADIEQRLGDGAKIVVASDQAPFISESIEHLAVEGLLGLLFAVLVILLFLGSPRATLVTAISIPLSILVTFLGLYLWGYSLNIFTLGALTIAIGRVVDDSIVVIENIKRHLGYGEDKFAAILAGTREVAAAITASTIATVLVFVPIALVGGFVGELFRPFALTVTIAMVSSLVVALTIVPVLSYWFVKPPTHIVVADEATEAGEDAEPNLLQRYYLPILKRTMRKPVAVIVGGVVLLAGSLALIPRLGVEFLGSTGENTINASQSFDSSLDIEQVTEQVSATESLMRGVTGVQDVLVTASLAGAGGPSLPAGPPQGSATGDTTATYTITTSADADTGEVQRALEDSLRTLPGGESVTVGISAGGLGSSTVDVKITGTDRATVDQAADLISRALADVAETTAIRNDRAADQTSLQVTVDRPAAAAFGLTEQTITGIVASAMSPRSVTNVTIEGNQFSVYVAGASVATQQDLESLPLVPGASLVLSNVATTAQVTGPSNVNRADGDLVATVSLTPAEGQLGAVQTEVQNRLDALELPPGVEVDLGGVTEQQSEAFAQLGLAMLVAVGLIYVLLVALLRSMLQPLILMISIPFAAIGAIGLLFITGTPLGVAALIGMLMLIGIVVTNAIVLMDLINQYRARGQIVVDAVYHGAGRRVRPIVMTALATIFALLPMATGITGGTGFISKALAIVVIGGLISSTALTLLLVPAVYQIVEGRHERRRGRHERTSGRPEEVLSSNVIGEGDRETPIEAR